MWSLDRGMRILLLGGATFFLSFLFHVLGLADMLLFFPGAWLLSSGTYLLFASLKVSVDGKAVLITGCDTGFGHRLAVHLHQLGFRVFAGCLFADSSGEGAESLRRVSSDRMHVLQLDVTQEQQIKCALHEVKRIMPRSEILWGVVNNAGISTFGAFEWVPMSTFRKLAEVNIFGNLAVTRTFMPLLRRAKGRVVNVTSAEGRMPCTLVSPYDLTKFAMEGFSDCLRNEMRPFGVTVVVVEPGNFTAATNLVTDEKIVAFAEEMWSVMDEEVKIAYGKQYFNDIIASRMSGARSGETNLTSVITDLVDALTSRYPQSRYLSATLDIFIRILVYQHCPEWIYDYLYFELARKWG